MNTNTLYYGDNLEILRNRAYFPNECVDLIYLDPPFNSGRVYDMVFEDNSSYVAFNDIWHWDNQAEITYQSLLMVENQKVARTIDTFRKIFGNKSMGAYLVMITARLVELHRILKPTGSLYLHCDSTASHYIRLILDTIFGPVQFQNQIIWERIKAKGISRRGMSNNHDVIFFYTKSDDWTWNKIDNIDDFWGDIPFLQGNSKEKLGYPTQKPVKLLERIIAMSSNPGDIILDPFCGCGTTIAAAQSLGRNWIGIDITHLSIALQKYRIQDAFGDIPYTIIGEPADIEGARQLAREDRYQFQWWALSLVRAKPIGGSDEDKKGKKGRDRGVDGVINFLELGEKVRRVIVQVKSGKVKSGDIRDLAGTLDREKAAIAIFITLEEPTRDMIAEANDAGYYIPPALGGDVKYRRIQIYTVEELMLGAKIEMPPSHGTFKQAGKMDSADKPENLPLL